MITIGDTVLIRNFNKKRKFDPEFTKDMYNVIDKSKDNTVITIRRESDGRVFMRHPNDIKVVHKPYHMKAERTLTEYEQIQLFHKQFDSLQENDDCDMQQVFSKGTDRNVSESPSTATELRRSERIRKPNSQYYNSDFVTQ